MTYQDALKLRKKLGTTFSKDHEGKIKMKILVTPSSHDDFKKYMTDFRSGGFTDETAIKYCRNGNFTVHALWHDGANVLYHPMTGKYD